MAKQYLDLEGLTSFLQKIQNYYSNSSPSDKDSNGQSITKVGYAATTGKLHSKIYLEIEENELSTLGSIETDFSDDTTVKITIPEATSTKKGLMSSGDYTKLSGIEEGAQVNIIENVKIATELKASTDEEGQPLLDENNNQLYEPDYKNSSVTNKTIKIDLSPYALKSEIVTVFRFRGAVNFKDTSSIPPETDVEHTVLPTTGMITGDVWHVNANGGEFVWDGTKWEELGSILNLDAYATKEYVDSAVSDVSDYVDTKYDYIINGKDGQNNDVYVAKATYATSAGTADSATVANKTTGTLSVKVTDEDTKTFDGSADISVDLSVYGLKTEVDKKANKPTLVEGKNTSTIAGVDASGNLVDTGTDISKLSDGEVASNNSSFVTGGQVHKYIKDSIQDEMTTYSFTDGTGGTFTVTTTKDGVSSDTTVSVGSVIEHLKVNSEEITIDTDTHTADIDLSTFTTGVVATKTIDTFTTSTESPTYSATLTEEPVSGEEVYLAFVGDKYITNINDSQILNLFGLTSTPDPDSSSDSGTPPTE